MPISLRSINSHKVAFGYRLIFGYVGLFFIVAGVACLIPLIMTIFYPEEWMYAHYFYIPGLAAIVVGVGLFSLIAKRDKVQLEKHQDSVLLVLVWLSSMLITAIPFLLRGMSFTDAFFETTSGHGTIGLTVFDFDSDIAPHCYILFRNVICFLGGVGLVLVVTSAISDRYGLRLYTAEGHNDKLMPNLVKSARLILGIYSAYIVAGTLAFWLIGGMQLFDAVNHSISCVATGGFSSRAGGLYEILTVDVANGVTNEIGLLVRPVAIEIIAPILMVLGATNFLLHMFIWSGKIKDFFKDGEVKTFFIMWIMFLPIMFASVYLSNIEQYDLLTSLRYSSFTFFSTITTTGFANCPSIVALGNISITFITFLNLFGGMAGSTAGGIKQYRILIATKSFHWSLQERTSSNRIVYPHNVYRFGEYKEVTEEEIHEAHSYILIYAALMFFLSIAMALIAYGQKIELNGVQVNFLDCIFELSNGISSTGLSNGLTALKNPAINWILIVSMFAGRLELYPFYFAFIRVGKDIFRREKA